MKDGTPKTIFLKDYQKPDYLISDIHLTFDLHNTATKVKSVMQVKCNYDDSDGNRPLTLNGEELILNSVKINNTIITADQYLLGEDSLTLRDLPKEFTLEIENTINPEANKALDGLYKSGDIFCTQNEPEGFRRITYYLDRPDIMAKFTTKVIADKKEFPILLSNGNPIGEGDLENGKHFMEWEDPFVKPAYLYALVAGDLGLVQDTYTTGSGREIDLRIYVDKGNESKCDHAMESLKNSMKWDEEVFGLEYDLDIYMIVAVDSFNMGAMENKGLNIFNSAYVLADPKSATDDNFYGIEGVIGHEYFHNWTGNRVTCRDWFQLTLKEGLTVFRDQEFSSDMNSRIVDRISNVIKLRASQFVEDAGPTAHPIKPESYIEINNFYTMTIYEKGSEIIRMYHTLLGKDGFRRGMDLYFKRHDGQAVTTEDFLSAMSDANDGYDFEQFKLWYSQSGTPDVKATYKFDEAAKTFAITFNQSCRPTPGQDLKKPYHMPMRLGLVDKNGNDLALNLESSKTAQPQLNEGLLHLREESETFVFTGINERPTPSLNRGFSAPVNLTTENDLSDNAFLMANDNDEFNRYEAAQVLGSSLLETLILDVQNNKELKLDEDYIEAYGKLLADTSIDDAFKAMAIIVPTEGSMHQKQNPIDFESTHIAREFMATELAKAHKSKMMEIYDSLNIEKEYALDPKSMGERNLKDAILGMLMSIKDDEIEAKCFTQFTNATNMTDELSALSQLTHNDAAKKEDALKSFYQKWNSETLVMQKWLSVQGSSPSADTSIKVKNLLTDDVYDNTVPNLVRSLIGAYASNTKHFHNKDGSGYKFIADQIIEIDKLNPQMGSRLASAFRYYKKLQEDNKVLVKAELERILAVKDLSKNVFEIISKTLNS
jgi:aminopeptidase N